MRAFHDVGRDFLIGIDFYIKENLTNITCSDIHDCYFDFFYDLKEFQGNSNGFTGLSEYLLFRFFYHLLGGSFTRIQKTEGLWEFVSDSGIKIGQNTPLETPGKKYYPDIVVYKDETPVFIVEIKIYLTSGIKEVEKEISKFDKIKKTYPRINALFISFNKISEGGKIFNKINTEMGKRNWLNFLMLGGNESLLKTEIETSFNLRNW